MLHEVIFMDDEGFGHSTPKFPGQSAEARMLLLDVAMLQHLVYVVLPSLIEELTVSLTATT